MCLAQTFVPTANFLFNDCYRLIIVHVIWAANFFQSIITSFLLDKQKHRNLYHLPLSNIKGLILETSLVNVSVANLGSPVQRSPVDPSKATCLSVIISRAHLQIHQWQFSEIVLGEGGVNFILHFLVHPFKIHRSFPK